MNPLFSSIQLLLSRLEADKKISYKYATSFLEGVNFYLKTGITRFDTYIQSRQLYYISGGLLPLYTCNAYSKMFPVPSSQLNLNGKGFSKRDAAREKLFEADLNEYGYLVLPSYISNHEALDEICVNLDKIYYYTGAEKSARIFSDSKFLVQTKLFRMISEDLFITGLIEGYLNCKPIIDLVAAWRLLPIPLNKANLDSDALMYHVDLDRTNFLKVFVYLTDVDQDCGPHCYVPQTHLLNIPNGVRQDRRYNDEEVHNLCSREPLVISGGKGTVIIADTHCLHKGTLPVSTHRDIFQVEYCNSLFGATYSTNIFNIDQNLFRDVQFTGASRL